MNSLGIDVGASDSDNMKNFEKMTVDTEKFTYDELVVWFETLSKLRNCSGMAAFEENSMYGNQVRIFIPTRINLIAKYNLV